jgi:hypothetical protein
VRRAIPFGLSGSPILTPPSGEDRGLDPVTLKSVGPQHGEARLFAPGPAYQETTK